MEPESPGRFLESGQLNVDCLRHFLTTRITIMKRVKTEATLHGTGSVGRQRLTVAHAGRCVVTVVALVALVAVCRSHRQGELAVMPVGQQELALEPGQLFPQGEILDLSYTS